MQVMARSRSLPHSVVRRAQMILMLAEGCSNTAIAEHFGLTLPSVGHWRKRYLSQGIAGLYDISRPGRPRSYNDDSVATLLNKVLKDCGLSAPAAASQSHWYIWFKNTLPVFKEPCSTDNSARYNLIAKKSLDCAALQDLARRP